MNPRFTTNENVIRPAARKMVATSAALIVFAISRPISAGEENHLPIAGLTAQSRQGMVVSVSLPASEIGVEVLQQGGNAVDAAVAVAFALAVTWPEAGNIGGGGFMLIHPSDGRPPLVIEYREKAPAAATVEMFAHGKRAPQVMVGVPGTVRGLELAHRQFGRLPWANLVLPAVRLAEEGFEVGDTLAASLNEGVAKFRENPGFLETFGQEQGTVSWKSGDRLVQNDLAKTLRAIATQGADAFYTGETAKLLAVEMERGGGLITQADLANYTANVCAPIHGTFRGYDIYAPPPPSSGGITLMQMLNLAEHFDLRRDPRWSVRTMHLMIESMRLAYFHRARSLGDPDFIEIPAKLSSKGFAAELAKSIPLNEAGTSAALGAEIVTSREGAQTTHFSLIDGDGMAVSNTYTLESSFGSGIVVRGAGFLLNDEMGDFNPQPGMTAIDGRIGTPPNLVAPGKRMLSSMCPTIVARDGRAVLITGSPGGRTIINTVFCVLINALEYGMPLRESVDTPRHHHQWLPDRMQIEPALSADHAETLNLLRKMGHQIQDRPVRQGDAHSIAIDLETGLRTGAADRRRGGWVVSVAPNEPTKSNAPTASVNQFLFTTQGKTALVRSDGTGLKFFDFDVPGQATWQPGPSFSDGRRMVFLSMEPRRDGPGKPFEEYYTQTPTHIWLHDLVSGSLSELCTKERIAPFETPAMLVGDERLLVQVVKDKVGRIVSMKLDGSDPRDFTKAGEGLPYGFSLSPDGKRVAFHLAAPGGYQVLTSDVDGANRVKLAGAPGHLYFGTSWSPDGKWVAYVDCLPKNDPGHDWADLCIGRPDGSEHRVLTKDQAMWFAATYGSPETRGGGSNIPAWTRDGAILFPRRIPGSKVPWEYRVGKPDLDHFNRDFKPQSARGGVCLSRLDPGDLRITDLTEPKEGVWDFRASDSPDGKQVVFCRAPTGEPPTIWVMNSDGSDPKPITKGIADKGCDHPRWLGR